MVEVPGWTSVRMEIERELARRGWPAATSPADADVLLICGMPGAEFAEVCDRLWSQLPGPRARVDIVFTGDAASSLDRAAAHLLDERRQRDDARSRLRLLSDDKAQNEHEHEHEHEQLVDAGGMDPSDHEEPAGENRDVTMNHESDAPSMDMDHPMDMDMEPGGIPLAEGGPDRDGLEMDVLHVPLGPVLPDWPAGLVVSCALQGDVIVSADVRVLGRMRGDEPLIHADVDSARSAILWRCDSAARLLSLAGWGSAALGIRAIRDDLLAGAQGEDVAQRLAQMSARVRRSLLLRWSLKGIRTADGSSASVEVRSRLLAWLREAEETARSGSTGHVRSSRDMQQALLDAIPALVEGLDLGTVRLAVAGLGLDTARLVSVEEHHHG